MILRRKLWLGTTCSLVLLASILLWLESGHLESSDTLLATSSVPKQAKSPCAAQSFTLVPIPHTFYSTETYDEAIQVLQSFSGESLLGFPSVWFEPLLVGDPTRLCNKELFQWHQTYGRVNELSKACNIMSRRAISLQRNEGFESVAIASPLFYVDRSLSERTATIYRTGKAIVQREGAIYTQSGDVIQGSRCCYCDARLKLRHRNDACNCLSTCWCGDKTPRECTLGQRHAFVFTVSTVFGSEYAHFFKEVLPRLAPHLGFLRTSKDIKIHVKTRKDKPPCAFIKQAFELLGIHPSRLVFGDVLASDVFYPASTTCGVSPDQFPGLWLARTHLLSSSLGVSPSSLHVLNRKDGRDGMRWKLVLIDRGSPRTLGRGPEAPFQTLLGALQKMRKRLREERGIQLDVELFTDNDAAMMKCLACQVRFFHDADIVLGDHGAGLTNVMFMRPGGIVVEFGWSQQQSEYLMLAHALGHRFIHVDYESTAQARFQLLISVLEYEVANKPHHLNNP